MAGGVTPLALKLFAVNVLVSLALLLAWVELEGHLNGAMTFAVIAAIVVQGSLMMTMLGPFRELETIALARWWREFGRDASPTDSADPQRLAMQTLYTATLQKLEGDRVRLRALATGLIVTSEDERSIVARQLFDSTAQHLAALMLELSSAGRSVDGEELAERLEAAREAAATALEEVRHLAETVHPNVLDTLGMEPALRKLARAMSHGNGIEIDVITSQPPVPLSSITQTVLYRVAEESVRNAVRHAAPKHIHIKLASVQGTLFLEVHDDGAGFDSEYALREARGSGLTNVRDQMELIGGTMNIRTAVGNGTSVVASIPLHGSAFGGPV